MSKTTKTLNPLHFEDLEPHRFEDLVRQLSYGLRSWHSIEAVGRKGVDEGIDIRAIERFSKNNSDELSEDSDEAVDQIKLSEKRTWIIQCKREQQMGPSKVEKVVNENLTGYEETPDVYVIAAACDFSKASRDIFREVVIDHEVEEFHLWGKAELEDMLFLPHNDHLLFAYFDISLQTKRRSMKRKARSRLAIKRKLDQIVGGVRESYFEPILIRNPENDGYPAIEDPEEFISDPPWRFWNIYGHMPPNNLAVISKKSYAYYDSDTKEWDALFDSDESWPHRRELADLPKEFVPDHKFDSEMRKYWQEEVSSENRAYYMELSFIPYDRIIAVDDIGDAFHEPPHLLVDYSLNNSPYIDKTVQIIQTEGAWSESFKTQALQKIEYFPDKITSS